MSIDGQHSGASFAVTIEPFLTTSATSIVEAEGGWALRTPDGSVGAQFEHTLIVARGEPIVVTR
jgi:methionyl aminopeptidase